MNLAYGFIAGIMLLLAFAFALVVYVVYRYYRNCGMTRKQAFLCTWRMYGE